ncbi:MAG: hypothetical protein ABEJ55_01310 [Halanaeroarchaeum sp.]
MRIRDVLGLSVARQRRANRAMQLSLVGFVFVGVYEGSLGVTLNAAIGLGVTQLPALLERDFDIPMDPALTLWISAAVFLHAFGTLGLPWMTENVYRTVWWWDHVTHALSSSLVAGAGYATARALDEHVHSLDFTPRFLFAFILLLTLAFGVLWEVLEFGLAGVASILGTETVLTQYGVSDTMFDLIFDAIGAGLVATLGAAHLVEVTESIQRRLETRG